MTREAGWRYGIMSTVMVSYLRLALWYHIYGYGVISTVGVMVSYLRFLMNSKKYTDK